MSYRKEQSFGMDIGDLSIKVMQVRQVKSTVKVTHFAEGALEAGLMSAGEPKDLERIAKRIKEILGEAHIAAHHVVAALPEARTFSKLVTIPKLANREQLRDKVREEMEKHVPFSPEEIWWDMDIVAEGDSTLTAFVGVAPRTLVEAYSRLLRAANLVPLALDLEVLAIARAAIPPEINLETITFIADLGATKSTLIATRGRLVQATVDLNIAAEKKPAASIYAEKLSATVNRMLETLASTSAKGVSSTLLLSGGGAALAKLPEILSKSLGFPVALAEPWKNAGGMPKDIAAPTRFTTVIGLAFYALELDRV